PPPGRDAAAIPGPGPAASILSDPVFSPLLDRHYRGTRVRAWTPGFRGPRREIFDQRFKIVSMARLLPGLRVADVGADTAAFTGLIARAVGAEGVVYALAGSPSHASELQALAQEYRVDNIRTVGSTGPEDPFPTAGIDLAFLRGSEHALAHPPAMLDAIHRALIPYGTLIVLDDRPQSDSRAPWDRSPRRTDRDAVVEAVQQAGFQLVEEPRVLTDSYFLRFEKLSDAPNIEVGPIESTAPTQAP
ncbi:MAG TPA: methyltransferase domain-containing protein, partial [Lamprocystis sp. (in: g-proteobacteria)]|nr:methyltransferase domain-containing protein [Lamprocystis sp. (in: g-proteobacteria)]